MAEVVLERVVKEFPSGIRAVHDLSLTVADGELVVLVGPSGCGKTTTLRLIAGLEEPTRGTIRLGGNVVNALPPHRRDVALVFQRPALYPHLSVRDNLAFGLRMRRPRWWRRGPRDSEPTLNEAVVAERVAAAARLLGLEDVLDRRPAQLSGGQQQRVALGRALVRRPAVFLLDEPLTGLDPPLRAEMRRELHLLHRRLSATMIYVTHDQVEAMALGDRLIVMHEGTVQQEGRPQELYERPGNRFVAGFIGWPTMSFIDGQLIGRDDRLGFLAGGHWLPLPPEQAQHLGLHLGQPVTLGIRPENVCVGKRSDGLGLEMEVTLAEPLGDRYLLTLRRDTWQLMAPFDAPAPPGTQQGLMVSINMGKAQFFDRSTGAVLGKGGPDG